MAAPQQLSVLLEKTRWRAVKISEKSQRAGFVVALPAWVPAGDGPAATKSALGCFCEWVFHRDATASLGEHLSGAYGIAVERVEELDVGTFKVQIKSGSPWVARVFPSTRPEADVQREVDVMHHLDPVGFPVEKFPVARPVSVLEGQPVVVTEFVHGSEMKSGAANFGRIGRLLGELHTVQVDEGWQRHPGGAWHHLALDTSPAGELMVLRSLLSPARHRVTVGEENLYDKLVAAVEAADACADLPHALGHPDLVPRNMIVRPGKSPTVIDWAGVGWYPRVMSLGSTLWAARDARSVSSAVGAYREKVTLSAAEMDRLATAVAHRPLVLACWSFITGREDLAWVAKCWENQLARSLKIADQARVAWSGGDR
ncbi:MAG TPA: phosphotransferase [Acidimicrobiales bacterium]|nr:phosphotransferase [Acidimicrobiales bacterium]